MFNIAKNSKYPGYHCGLASMLCKFFDKKSFAMRANKFAGGAIKNEILLNQHPLDLAHVARVSDLTRELPEELHKSIIRKFDKRKYTHLLKAIFGLLILHICN